MFLSCRWKLEVFKIPCPALWLVRIWELCALHLNTPLPTLWKWASYFIYCLSPLCVTLWTLHNPCILCEKKVFSIWTFPLCCRQIKFQCLSPPPNARAKHIHIVFHIFLTNFLKNHSTLLPCHWMDKVGSGNGGCNSTISGGPHLSQGSGREHVAPVVPCRWWLFDNSTWSNSRPSLLSTHYKARQAGLKSTCF